MAKFNEKRETKHVPSEVNKMGEDAYKLSLHQGDMTDFNMGKTYDVVMCLFSSIGYVKTLENVAASLQNF